MGITLALNTATDTTEIAFVDGDTVLKEDSWPAESNESDKLLPYLRDALFDLGLSFQDLDALFVVKGPGSFTAVRVGVTIINTLGFVLKIPIYAVKTDELTGSLAETILSMDLDKMEKKETIEPFYLKPPNITPPKK